MTATRTTKAEHAYRKHLRTADTDVCVFCGVKKGDQRYIAETKSFQVVRNNFPYTLWDNQPVAEHLMITPKQHIGNLNKLTDEQKIEYLDLLEKYTIKGYNTYTRASTSKIRTIAHYHTHLIKPGDSITTFVFSIRKPYIRITK
ncbi:MAG: hypothetical protein ABIP50_01840 [Candidatus Saccharimonadales bacterium]